MLLLLPLMVLFFVLEEEAGLVDIVHIHTVRLLSACKFFFNIRLMVASKVSIRS